MVIGLKEGTSSYPHIPVLELTPAQLAENKQRAEALGDRVMAWTKSLQAELKAMGAPSISVRALVKEYAQSTHRNPQSYESERKILAKQILEQMHINPFYKKTAAEREKIIDFIQYKIDPMLEEIDAAFPGQSRAALIYKAMSPIYFNRRQSVEADCLARFNSASLCQAITADHDMSLEDAIAQEQRSRTLYLENVNEVSAKEALNFSPYSLGKNRAHYARRIISGADAIIADYLPHQRGIEAENIYCFDRHLSKGTQHLSYRFGFIKYMVPANSERGPYLCVGAAYFFDPRLLHQLKEQRGDDRLDERLLTGFLTAARLADHDYFHHLTLTTHHDSLASPLEAHWLDKQYKDIEFQHIPRLTKEKWYDLASYENSSKSLHYVAMQELFERQPRIKTRVIEQAVNFFEMAQEFRNRLVATHALPDPEANESAQFLTKQYADRLFHVLPYADIDTKVKDQNGALTTIRKQWDALYHKSHPTPKIAMFMEGIKITPHHQRKKKVFDTDTDMMLASHAQTIQVVRNEREAKNAQLRKFEYGYFLGKDGLVEQLEYTLVSQALTHMVDKERLQEMVEQVATFKLLMQQIATRVERDSLDMVGKPIMYNGTYVFRAIKDNLPQAADQLMQVALEVQDAGAYDMQSIAEKLARLKDAWRETTEQKSRA